MKKLLGITFILLAALLLPTGSEAQDFPDVCQQPENILPNCTFDNGLAGWTPFLETGGANISVLQGGGECHAPLCPAAYIVSEDHFIGGIYQQVSVTKGANYYANIVWLVFDSLVNDKSINDAVGGGIGRRIGIDPTGGTDPKSGNVVWSEDNWRNDCKICNVEHVTVTAQADTITVFLRLDDTWRVRAAERGFAVPPSKDQFWIDDIGLKQVGGDPIPVQQSEAPTDTPEPPADTPVPPTDTPAPPAADTATPEPEEPAPTEAPTAEPSPTPEPTPAATATSTPLPPPTLTPTRTASPTATLPPRPTRTLRPTLGAGGSNPTGGDIDTSFVLEAAGTTICVGGIAMVGLAVVIAGLVWLYRLGWGGKE